MPRPKAPCGSYSAYKRHLKYDEPVDDACRRASDERVTEQREARKAAEPPVAPQHGIEAPSPGKSRQESLEWNLRLIEAAMVDVEPSKLAPLSKRHSELLAELATVTGSGEKKGVDPFDEFFSGDLSNVVGFPAAANREAS